MRLLYDGEYISYRVIKEITGVGEIAVNLKIDSALRRGENLLNVGSLKNIGISLSDEEAKKYKGVSIIRSRKSFNSKIRGIKPWNKDKDDTKKTISVIYFEGERMTLNELAFKLDYALHTVYHYTKEYKEIEVNFDGVLKKGVVEKEGIKGRKKIPYVWDGETLYKDLTVMEASKVAYVRYTYLSTKYSRLPATIGRFFFSKEHPRETFSHIKNIGFKEGKVFIHSSPTKLYDDMNISASGKTFCSKFRNNGEYITDNFQIYKGWKLKELNCDFD